MKALDHNTRLAKVDGKSVPPPDDEVLEIYLGVVHTSPGMLVRDIKYILEAASELIPENKPVIIGGDWYMQRGAKGAWEQLQEHELWTLGLPGGPPTTRKARSARSPITGCSTRPTPGSRVRRSGSSHHR